MSYIEKQIRDSIKVKQALLADRSLRRTIAAAADCIVGAFRGGRKLLLAGNGGSAADAQHMAGELVNRFRFDRAALPAIALSTDTSVLTAVGNDSDFKNVFLRQLEALGAPGDVFIGISTSGQSPNVLRALRACGRLGVSAVGLTGRGGGMLSGLCDLCIRAPARDTARVQEAHILIIHLLCGLIEEKVFGKYKP